MCLFPPLPTSHLPQCTPPTHTHLLLNVLLNISARYYRQLAATLRTAMRHALAQPLPNFPAKLLGTERRVEGGVCETKICFAFSSPQQPGGQRQNTAGTKCREFVPTSLLHKIECSQCRSLPEAPATLRDSKGHVELSLSPPGMGRKLLSACLRAKCRQLLSDIGSHTRS